MTEQRLQVLPNKDLWRGHTRQTSREADSAVVKSTTEVNTNLSPLDRAYAAVIESAKGGPLNCLWCGQQYTELTLREHLDKNHPSVTNPMSNAEVAMHANAPVVVKE